MKKTLLLQLCLLAYLFAGAFEPPRMQCIELHDQTHLKVYWMNPANAAASNITTYYFYCNNSLIDSITDQPNLHPYNVGDRILSAAHADTYSCYIIAKNANNELACSDTIQTIDLQISTIQSTSPNGDIGIDAQLTWTNPTTQLDNTWGNHYYIYKMRAFENSLSISDSVSNTTFTYTDIADVCGDTIYYAVGIKHSYMIPLESGGYSQRECPFTSSTRSAFVIDHTIPATPILDSVSFMEDGKVKLGFHAPEPYMMGYIIYEVLNSNLPLDTIYQTFFIDPNGRGREYRISTIDSCFPRSESSAISENPQKAMILNVTPNACLLQANLSWPTYKNMAGGVDHYEVFLSNDNGTSYQNVGRSSTTSFTIDNLQLNENYRCFVRAFNPNGTITTSSDRVNFTLEADESFNFTYIRSVSVVNNNHIEVLVHTSGDTLPFNTISLQRSLDGTNFETISTLPHQNGVSGYLFKDSTAHFNKNVYYYQTYIENSCNQPDARSNISHNILLKGEASHQENILNWNDYGTWNGNVAQYLINRKLESENTYSEISGGIDNSSYFDDVATLYELGSKFSYYVQAEENPNEYGFADTANSNCITVEQKPSFYIPNAFTPTWTVNRIFKPLNSFMPQDGSYSFTIFSRQGEILFHTSDPNAGWDGRKNGKLCPTGVYVYKLTYIIPGDITPVIHEGSVTLIH